MNSRRGFLKQLIKLGVGAAILPSAVTYARKWVVQESLVIPAELEITWGEFNGVLNTGLVLHRNLEFLKNKMRLLEAIEQDMRWALPANQEYLKLIGYPAAVTTRYINPPNE